MCFAGCNPVLCANPAAIKKNAAGKSKEELALEKKRELERRLQDVSGQLNSGKKPAKTKGKIHTDTPLCNLKPLNLSLLITAFSTSRSDPMFYINISTTANRHVVFTCQSFH